MRGKACKTGQGHAKRGITPAYAGKRLIDCSSNVFLKDHPRLCGEKKMLYLFIYIFLGSPPPMRGKANHSNKRNQLYRITPAYAGKSCEDVKQMVLSQDHPRLCGEKLNFKAHVNRKPGSPPPMRGKAFDSAFVSPCFRITPAYAGKSRFPGSCCSVLKDHPRLCGEKRS